MGKRFLPGRVSEVTADRRSQGRAVTQAPSSLLFGLRKRNTIRWWGQHGILLLWVRRTTDDFLRIANVALQIV